MIRRPPRSTPTDTLFPYTTRFRSAGGAADERNLAAIGEPGADADHCLLGDADVDQPRGKAVAELAELGRSDRIIDHRDDARVGGGQVLDRADIGVAAIEQGDGSAHRSISSSSSRIAWEYCSAFGTPWCQPAWSRMKLTPWPLWGSAIRHSGRSRGPRAASKAASSAA